MTKLTGHVRQKEKKPRAKCRVWDLVVNLPCEDGKYPKRVRRFEGAYREAQAALQDLIAEVEGTSAGGMSTFSAYAREWHGRRVASMAYAQRTMDRELHRIKTAEMHLGSHEMRSVTRSDIEGLYASLMSGDSPSGKRLRPWTISSIHTTLSKLFSDAVSDGDIPSNPCDGVRLPQRSAADGRVPTTQEVDSMLAQLDMSDARHRALALCAGCGLRRSEAVAVEWVDLADGVLHVWRSLDDSGVPKPTKTGEERDVPVPSAIREALEQHRRVGQICAMTPPALSRWWRRNRHRWGMDGVRLHDLRHAYATRLAEAGVHPRVMMQLGGWASVNVCMKIYTHVHDVALGDAVARAFDSV